MLTTICRSSCRSDSFTHRITCLVPLYPYTLASTRCPDHHFLQLCALTFTPNLAPRELRSLIDRSIIHATCGAIGIDVVQSLLVLSISPLTSSMTDGPTRCRLCPVSLIEMAYTMGLRLGLEEQGKAVFGKGAAWAESIDPKKKSVVLMVSAPDV
jgi:hypothetical protein